MMHEKIIEDTESPLVHHLVKHQRYCQILIDICSGKDFLAQERSTLLKLIEMCIKLEVDLIQHLQLMIDDNDSPSANFLLQEYEKEEEMHYIMLKQLLERIFRAKPPEQEADAINASKMIFRAVFPSKKVLMS